MNLTKDQILDVINHLRYSDLLRFCRANWKINSICRSESGKKIFRAKYAEYQDSVRRVLSDLYHVRSVTLNHNDTIIHIQPVSRTVRPYPVSTVYRISQYSPMDTPSYIGPATSFLNKDRTKQGYIRVIDAGDIGEEVRTILRRI